MLLVLSGWFCRMLFLGRFSFSYIHRTAMIARIIGKPFDIRNKKDFTIKDSLCSFERLTTVFELVNSTYGMLMYLLLDLSRFFCFRDPTYEVSGIFSFQVS